MDMNKILDYVQGITENLEDLIAALEERCERDGAIYVDDEQNIKFVSLDEAYDVIADFGKNSESVMIGNSDYILIYDADKKIVIDGEAYLPADFVVMRSYYGLQPISREEANTVISALISRMATLVCGNCRLQAYQLD